ncbi:EAL domain-containing protein [Bacillus sp. CGMCC 1.16541]|uniref:EAL domain-containing protein n=1 Tax=Bacillus sp. CGMCC 1.16541 TaxID=2185143 RepID=UPI000D72AF4A|nr:EAL domain-containing protein [Bacillus sp. CGMCC 1.16541]
MIDRYINKESYDIFFSFLPLVVSLLVLGLALFLMYQSRNFRRQRLFKEAIFTSLMDPIIVVNREGMVVDMNTEGEKWFSSQVINQPISTILPDVEDLHALAGNRIEHTLTLQGGAVKWIELTVLVVETNYLVSMRDITPQKEFSTDLQEVNNRYQQLFDASPLPIVVHRLGKIVSVNQETLRIVGTTTKDEAIGRDVTEFFRKEERPFIQQLIDELTNGELTRGDIVREITILNDEEKQLVLETKSNVIYIKGVTYIQTILRDVTDERKAYEARLHTTYEDRLTGLPNAAFFHTIAKNRMERAKREDMSLGVMVIDLDRFRFFNDTYGREFGDLIIKKIVKRIQQEISSHDLLASFGTDGFLVMVQNGEKEAVRTLGKQILTRIQQPFHLDQVEVFLSASIGVSVYPQNSVNLDTLIRQAEMAMYHTKRMGRNNLTLYEPSIQQADTRKMMIEDHLHRAIANEEFELHYQPKIYVNTGEIAAVEALIRWNHPVLGQVSPAEFIPIAEETGLIVPISEWVLQTACRQNKQWQDQGMPWMRVAVNISSVEFGEEDFVKKVVDILDETKLDPCYLELEITESVAIKNIGIVIEKLRKLKQVGVYISIDDFGSGYSSLSYIKKLPINALKVDRSFIQDLRMDETEATIVKAIITIAKSLKLDVVAEGVEQEEQVHILKKEQCDEIQGYYFSKPLRVEEFEQAYQVTKQDVING